MSVLQLDLRDIPVSEILSSGAVRAAAEELNRCNAALRAHEAEFERRFADGAQSPGSEDDYRQWESRFAELAEARQAAASGYDQAQWKRGIPDMTTATDTLTSEFRNYIRSGNDGELRALGVGTGSAGGYTVPTGFRNDFVARMKLYGGVREAAEVVTTDSGADLPFPTVDDTGNVGAILSENTQVTEQDVVLGTETLRAYTYTSKLVRVSLQLIQDSAFDVDAWLRDTLSIRIWRAQNTHFTTGTGTAQPEGLVTGGTVGVTAATGGTTTVTYDNLIDLQNSVDPAYWNNASWMLNSTTMATLRKLKDGDSRPLVEPDLQAAGPGRLLGFPIVLNQDMPSPAASAKPIAFGDFKQGYVIRDVNSVEIARLVERYMDFLQHGVLAWMRSDGIVRDVNAYRLFQNSAT